MRRQTAAFLLVTLAAATVLAATESDRFIIEEYSFTCPLAQSGDAILSVEKTHESTRLILKSGDDFVMLSPDEAASVGQALAATDKYWSKMKGSKVKTSDTVKAGEFSVTFAQDPRFGFAIAVSKPESFVFGRAALDRKQALDLAPHFSKAVERAAYVDKFIDAAIDGQRR